MVVCALAAIGYFYVAKPVVHGVKKASHAVCHVLTLGQKCKPQEKAKK